MALSSTRASLLGTIGQRRRWAKTVDPEARRQATQAARDALTAKYLTAARIMPGGDRLDDRRLAERARQLRLADLAQARLKSWEARRKNLAVGS